MNVQEVSFLMQKAFSKLERSRVHRDSRFDNLRALLIFLVVFCHLSEAFCKPNGNLFYLVVYSFHVPCLLFISGYFARFDARKLLRRVLLPYAVFQTLYTLFDALWLHPGSGVSLQFSCPYWLLWYLLTLFCLYLLLPLLTTRNPRKAVFILLILTALSLHIGTDSLAGYTFSLSRTVVFLPCFFLGHSAGTCFAPGFLDGLRRRRKLCLLLLAAAVLLYELLLLGQKPTPEQLYGAASYEKAGGGPWLRLQFLTGSMLWMLLLLLLSPGRRIPLWTQIGQGTLPVYLLHGFVQRFLIKEQMFRGSQAGNFLWAFALTWVIVVLLSSKPVCRLFRSLF